MDNEIFSTLDLVGNCARKQTPFQYQDGIGKAARLKFPDHGQMTKDSKYILFVDKQSCARRVTMSTLQVETIIGLCDTFTIMIPSCLSESFKRMICIICLDRLETPPVSTLIIVIQISYSFLTYC